MRAWLKEGETRMGKEMKQHKAVEARHEAKHEGSSKKGKTIQLEFSELTLWRLGTLVFGVLFIIAWATGGFGTGSASGGGTIPPPQSQVPPPQQPPAKVDVSADDDPFQGDKDAPVQIIEFSDFQCPFCNRFWQQTYRELITKYVDTGKAYFVYRDFPLDFHPMAVPAAIAAECAREQGGDEVFFNFHDKIFATQQTWSTSNDKNFFKTLAKDVGVDQGKFDECFDNEKYKDEVMKDYADGQAAGVQGTPTVFINGKPLVGAQPTQNFVQAIEAELAS